MHISCSYKKLFHLFANILTDLCHWRFDQVFEIAKLASSLEMNGTVVILKFSYNPINQGSEFKLLFLLFGKRLYG